jgi:hypothetical protein
MPLNKDWREFIELLNSNGVEYVVVGAFAVAYHGFPRYTGDLDLLVRASAENSERLVRALVSFGFGFLGIRGEDFLSPEKIIQLGVQPNRIDLLTSISGVDFEHVWETRKAGELDGVQTHFIGREALIENKLATGRAKDLGDAEELRKREGEADRPQMNTDEHG